METLPKLKIISNKPIKHRLKLHKTTLNVFMLKISSYFSLLELERGKNSLNEWMIDWLKKIQDYILDMF